MLRAQKNNPPNDQRQVKRKATHSCLERSLDPSFRSARPKSRARDTISSENRPIDTDKDASALVLVQRVRLDTRRVCGAGTGDLESEALRIVLRAVFLVGGVQGDDLVAEDVAAWCERRGDGYGPGVVVCD